MFYDEIIQLEYRLNYKDGLREGTQEVVSDVDGWVIRYNSKDGELNGLWESYDENGEIITSFCYKNDEKIDMSYCED